MTHLFSTMNFFNDWEHVGTKIFMAQQVFKSSSGKFGHLLRDFSNVSVWLSTSFEPLMQFFEKI